MPRYSELIMEHFRHPRNIGAIEAADAVGEDTNPICGDRLRLTLRIEGDVVLEARFQTEGCVGAIAAGSVATELLKGRTLAGARGLTREEIDRALGGLPPAKRHAAVLVESCLRKALASYPRAQG
ncbi:MAG: iron-sulfur cluster assembly scaffold protein [Dehalococcoidia bacterium]|nr:iron-sulfur cluster assembly scaffold protein [Dehalococcoidia bacterium]